MFVMQEFLKDLVEESSFVRFHNFKDTHEFLTGKGLTVAKESTVDSSGPVVIHYKPAPAIMHLGFPDVCVLPCGYANTPVETDFKKIIITHSPVLIEPTRPCLSVVSGMEGGVASGIMRSTRVFAYSPAILIDGKKVDMTINPVQHKLLALR